MNKWNWILLAASALTLGGCQDDTNYDFAAAEADAAAAQQAANAAAVETPLGMALFDPSNGIVPTATNLLFMGSADGTLNIPINPSESAGAQALKATLNALDGFSTTAPIVTTFDLPLNPASVLPRRNVRLFEVTLNAAGAAIALNGEVAYGTFTALATGDNTSLVIQPLKPLKADTSYLVVLTDSLRAADGRAMQPSVVYALAKGSTPLSGDYAAAEPLRQLTNSFEAVAAAGGVDPSQIILSWTFTTQSTMSALQTMAASVGASASYSGANTGLTTHDVNASLPGLADIYSGTLDLPYYLSAPSVANPTAPITTHWLTASGGEVTRYARVASATSTQSVPYIMTLPNATAGLLSGCALPSSGWPVVIFAHGINQQKEHLYAIADTLAKACYAGIAIDLPLHGARTFNVDYINNTTRAPGSDGVADPSGAHFINLSSLLTSRDNVRQGVLDLIGLRRTLDQLGPLDGDNVSFVGHSLGGMVGTLFTALEPDLVASVLAMPGGGIPRLLDGSVEFGPEIQAGLAANGVAPGSADYASFMAVASAALDAGDPLNYAGTVSVPTLLFEVVGGGGSPADTVIPNTTAASPLAGTEPLIRALGLVSKSTNATNAAGLNAVVRYSAGDHGSLLTPDSRLNSVTDIDHLSVMSEMQSEMAGYLLSQGTRLTITDGSVIAAP